jgi:hypothetical protein
LPHARAAQVAARLALWFAGGVALALAVTLTAMALPGARPAHLPAWRIAGLGGAAFIAIELIAHVVLQLRGRPSVFNGRG